MQTLHVAHMHTRPGVDAFQRGLYAARRILDKHQVAAVERGKGLFVGALDGGLHGRAQRLLHAGDQGQDAQVGRITGQVYADLGLAALAVCRGQGAMPAQPGGYLVGLHQWLARKGLQKALLQQLARQCCRAGAGRGIAHAHLQPQLEHALRQRGVQAHGIGLPARQIVGDQGGPLGQQVQRQAHSGAAALAVEVAVDHGLQRMAQRQGRQRGFLGQAVQLPVQPGHVYALDMGRRKIDLHIGARMQLAPVAGLGHGHGQVYALHAHPLQRAEAGRGIGQGNIGKRCKHSGLQGPRPRGRRGKRSMSAQGRLRADSVPAGHQFHPGKGLSHCVQACGPMAISASVSRHSSRRARSACSSMPMPISTSSWRASPTPSTHLSRMRSTLSGSRGQRSASTAAHQWPAGPWRATAPAWDQEPASAGWLASQKNPLERTTPGHSLCTRPKKRRG
ncbi:conserved hypothetical protein [Ricinus communis]|uniref:Uncharacterized protein n=1 Tax=Ricinus communis TaxID=3988 RepID=B9TE05_RICCO|nr:conserved hypothetical protein [Ricinus communis]